MNETILKLLGLLITSYWWFPLMRIVVEETWRVADQNADEGPRAFSLSAAHRRGSEGWSAANAEDRNPSNSSWSIGRRPVQRRDQNFHNNSRGGVALTSFSRRRGS